MTPRIGSVSYLNALPLTCGIEDQVVFTTPARLAEMLRRGELDAALVSSTEALFNDGYDVLDGIAIASRGPVKSVFLAHRVPLAEMREIFLDPASLSSVGLLRVLLAQHGLKAALRPLTSYERAADCEAVLLIGDRALDFCLAPCQHEIWDLGKVWYSLTGLPFVHAAWILPRGADASRLGPLLRAARDRGLARLEEMIRARTDYTLEFRRRYLTENVRFDLGEAEKQGLRRFAELLRQQQNQEVFDPRFV